jgi:hypothetical protein
MENKDFCVFILTYGRPNKVITLDTLKRENYNGDYFLVCSDDDNKLDEYKNKYGDKVVVFSKKDYIKDYDLFDNFDKMGVIIFARNACFDIAEKLGYKYFVELDDDYTDFRYKYDNDLNYIDRKEVKNISDMFNNMLNFYKNIPAKTIAFAQGGDFIGGKNTKRVVNTKRKSMNSFFCSTERRFKFIGRINEDVNTYCNLGSKGELFLQINQVALNQLITQSNKGGMTELYLDSGTYIKSFYTIICNPSGCKISVMGNRNKRLHHRITWKNTCPKIISEENKKRYE